MLLVGVGLVLLFQSIIENIFETNSFATDGGGADRDDGGKWCDGAKIPLSLFRSFFVKAWDCSDKLTLREGPEDVEIPFESGGADITQAANYEEFFTASDKTNCPVTSCVLSDISSCGTSLNSGSNLSIGSSPWAISAK